MLGPHYVFNRTLNQASLKVVAYFSLLKYQKEVSKNAEDFYMSFSRLSLVFELCLVHMTRAIDVERNSGK